MNKLSWILYFSDIVQNVRSAFEPIIVLSFSFLVLILIIYLCWEVFELRDDWKKPIRKYIVIAACIAVFFGGLRLFIPTKETLLAIAASETAERVARTTEGKEILNKLKDKIMERVR